jgi:hypothetical protein
VFWIVAFGPERCAMRSFDFAVMCQTSLPMS